MLKNIKIMPKLIAGFAGLALINLLVAGIIFYNTTALQDSLEDSKNLTVLMEELDEYHTDIDQQHALIQDYINSGDISAIERYSENNAQIEADYKKLQERLTSASQENIPLLNEIQDGYTAWKNDFAERQMLYMQRPETINMARAMELSKENKSKLDKISDSLKQLTSNMDTISSNILENANHRMSASMIAVIAGSLILIAACILSGVFFGSIIASPLKKMAETTEALRNRQWDVEVEGTDRGDEIGIMAKSLDTLRLSGAEADRLKSEQERENAMKLQRSQRIEALVNSFEGEIEQLMKDLSTVANDMQTTSVTLGQVAQETNEQTSSATTMAERAGANVQNVASATEELTISINEISKQLQDANRSSSKAEETVNEAVGYIKNLESSADQISDIISLITNIAEQTNLLALNATIESARAGEAGKGFSVVANEVKSLATETAKATEEISEKIQTLQSETVVATSTIARIADMVRAMNEASTVVAATMEEQSVATQDIARNITEVAQGTAEVSNNLVSVNDNTRETERAASSVRSVAQRLKEQSERLEKGVSSFIEGIRTA